MAEWLQLSMRARGLFSQWNTSEGALLCFVITFSFTEAFLFDFQIAEISWFYYVSKFTDFFETIIFILLKRFDMVNLYHVAHHSIMPVSYCLKYFSRNQNHFINIFRSQSGGVLNSWLVIAWSLQFSDYMTFCIFSRRTLNVLRIHKHSSAYRHLHLSRTHHSVSENQEVLLLVENVLPILPNWTVCFGFYSRISTDMEERVQLSDGFCVLYKRSCGAVLSAGDE